MQATFNIGMAALARVLAVNKTRSVRRLSGIRPCEHLLKTSNSKHVDVAVFTFGVLFMKKVDFSFRADQKVLAR